MEKRFESSYRIVSICWVAFFIIIFLSALFGCNTEQITEPEFTISGRYQSDELQMIVLLDQSGSYVEVQIDWQGYGGHLSGMFDRNIIGDGQVIMDGTIGNKKCHMSIFYSKAKQTLSGGFILYTDWETTGTMPISLKYVNKLDKHFIHDQGGIQ